MVIFDCYFSLYVFSGRAGLLFKPLCVIVDSPDLLPASSKAEKEIAKPRKVRLSTRNPSESQLLIQPHLNTNCRDQTLVLEHLGLCEPFSVFNIVNICRFTPHLLAKRTVTSKRKHLV